MPGMIDEPLTIVFSPAECELMRRTLTYVVGELEDILEDDTDDDDPRPRRDILAAAYTSQQVIDVLLRKFMHPDEVARMEANKNKRREEALAEARKAAGVADLA
jgi:hypothetical protein